LREALIDVLEGIEEWKVAEPLPRIYTKKKRDVIATVDLGSAMSNQAVRDIGLNNIGKAPNQRGN
jgi:hypothetical protein